ncbi:MAG: hypothetical protein DRP64_19510 [Verrucomicrobia bacterium]|nr:MAG: hypothetical protein DRP64_19510 [Verrucomicrobiota bacterium]
MKFARAMKIDNTTIKGPAPIAAGCEASLKTCKPTFATIPALLQQLITVVAATLVLAGCSGEEAERQSKKKAVFSFIATADMRNFAGSEHQSSEYFFGTCEAIKAIGKGAFMVSPGDIDPPQQVLETIKKVLGEDYPWYPVVGNHESETPEDMAWLRNRGMQDIPNLVRRGPENGEETTYSFDFKNAHFVVLNEYYDGESDTGSNGDITDPLHLWLTQDLEENTKPLVFVFGHEPILSIPDYHNGRHRHQGDCLNAHPENSHRFQQLLRKHKVTAYICGHTHNFSHANINGLWQLDAGHSRGIGDTGAPSTFLKFLVGKRTCWVDVYRDDANGGPYSLVQTIELPFLMPR